MDAIHFDVFQRLATRLLTRAKRRGVEATHPSNQIRFDETSWEYNANSAEDGVPHIEYGLLIDDRTIRIIDGIFWDGRDLERSRPNGIFTHGDDPSRAGFYDRVPSEDRWTVTLYTERSNRYHYSLDWYRHSLRHPKYVETWKWDFDNRDAESCFEVARNPVREQLAGGSAPSRRLPNSRFRVPSNS